MKTPLEKMLKKIQVPQSNEYKANLKQKLLKDYEASPSAQPKYNFTIARALQFGFATVALIAIVFTLQPALNKPSSQQIANNNSSQDQNHFFEFIQNAKAYADENINKIQYNKVKFQMVNLENNQTFGESESENWSKNNLLSLTKSIRNDTGKTEVSWDLSRTDDQGNVFLYTKNAEGNVVHPDKRLDYNKELNRINNDLFCINNESDAQFIGVSTLRISNNDFKNFELSSMSYSKNKKYSAVGKILESIARNHLLTKSELLNIMDEYKELLTYNSLEENGQKYYKVSFNSKDFITISSSAPIDDELINRMNNEYSFYFNIQTYALEKIEITSFAFDKPSNRQSIIFSETKYLDNIDENTLFSPEGYVLFQASSNIENKIWAKETIENGCYQGGKMQDPEFSASVIKKYKNSTIKANQQMWDHPLMNNGQYMYLPE